MPIKKLPSARIIKAAIAFLLLSPHCRRWHCLEGKARLPDILSIDSLGDTAQPYSLYDTTRNGNLASITIVVRTHFMQLR